ncbi:MAG: hypothetical protein ACRYHQ_01095 [Janthinobacterium lividum]
MAKYETDVHLPPVAGVQKPGVERYAIPHKIAEQMKEKLADDSNVEASWEDGCKLSVIVEQNGDHPNQTMQVVQQALQDVVGPAAMVSPFHPLAGDA